MTAAAPATPVLAALASATQPVGQVWAEQVGLAVQPDRVSAAPLVTVTDTVPEKPEAHVSSPTPGRPSVVEPAVPAATMLADVIAVLESRMTIGLQHVSVSPVAA